MNADFTQGSILKKLSLFMLPVLGALVLQAAYGAVDLLVVGQFGSTAGLSAVSTGSQVLNLVTFVVTQLAMGVTVLIARYLGEKRHEQIGAVIGGAAVVFTILSFLIFVLLAGFARPISVLMQAPEAAVGLTTSYVRICGCGIFFIVCYNLLSAIFRGLGDSRSPLIFVLVACVVNIVGDLPLALQEFLTQLSFLALCAFVNRLGLAASSGYGVACKIVNFAMLIPSALMQSMASFVAQNVGAGDQKRARRAMVTGIGVGLAFGCGVFALILLKGDALAGVFTPDPEVIQKGFEYLKGFAPETIATAVLFSMVGYFNGNDQTLWVMVQGLVQTLLVRLPMAYFMSIQPNASLTMIGLAAPTSTAVGIVLNVGFYLWWTRKSRAGAALA
ncbi:MATE family efflux transporter [Lawsonibacter sp. LCP25S3_F5]